VGGDLRDLSPRRGRGAGAGAGRRDGAAGLFLLQRVSQPNSVWDEKVDSYGYDQYGAGENYWWCECPVCGALGITDTGWSRELPCRCVWRVHIEYAKEYTYNSPRLEAAYNTVGALNVENLLVTE